MGYVKKLVYLTEEQKNTLFANGSITVGGKTITYDPNDVYVTPRDIPDFQVGTVETLPAGSQATASITGTGDTPVINLGIPKGDQGVQGPQGVKGDTGEKGDKGDKGDQGDQGPQGVKGDTGAKGDKGDKGDTGNTGPAGLTPDLTIGTVQTLPAGSSATASITGTDEQPVLNLGIPKGDAGEVTQAEFDALSDTVDDMQDTLEHKADIDGYYTDMTVGAAEQVVSSTMVEDNAPYKIRTSGGSTDIGNRAYVDKIVGGTVAWNQQVRDAASENVTEYADVVTVTDAVEDDAAVSVRVEPVQDLHGYDAPWPAGGGKNLLPLSLADIKSANSTYGSWSDNKYTFRGITWTIEIDNAENVVGITANGTATQEAGLVITPTFDINGSYSLSGCPTGGNGTSTYNVRIHDASTSAVITSDYGSGSTFTTTNSVRARIMIYDGYTASNVKFYPMLRLSSVSDATFTPYSNICPITGWDEVNVWDDSRYGGLVEWNQQAHNLNATNWRTESGVTASIENGIATFSSQIVNNGLYSLNYCPLTNGHIYYVAFSTRANNGVGVRQSISGASGFSNNVIGNGEWISIGKIARADADTNTRMYIIATTADGGDIETKNIMLCDLTAMFGATKAEEIYAMEQAESGTGVAYFRSLFPADGYPYNAGETMTVGQVNSETYRHYTITLPTEAGTVYGGELTVNKDGSGSLVVNRASIVYDGSNDESWIGSDSLPWRYGITVNGIKQGSAISFYVISNLLPTTANHWSYSNYGILNNYNQLVVGYPPAQNDVVAFKAFLASNPLQVVYKLATPITYTLTATQVRTLLGTNNVWSDAGQLSLTYTGTDEYLTLTSGRKYLTRINGTDSMVLGAGQTVTAVKGTDNVFDLTQMLGTSVADYVYQQGASYFRKWFSNSRYAYNAGELISVQGLQSREVVGFNQWDEEWELGYITDSTGGNHSGSSWIRSKNYFPVIPNTVYYFKNGGATSNADVYFYDANKTYLGRYTGGHQTLTNANQTFTTPSDAHYMRFYMADTYGATYNHDICINLSHNGTRNGSYEPYTHRSYPLDSTLTLRGIPKVGASGVYWDGDEYGYEGDVARKYGIMHVTAEMVTSVSSAYTNVTYAIMNCANDGEKTLTKVGISSLYGEAVRIFPFDTNAAIGKLVFNAVATQWWVGFPAGTTLTQAKEALDGMDILYLLATPTTETAQPYQQIQHVDDWGTEEFVSGTITPVGHLSKYTYNLRDKLQHLPNLAGSNGKYIISQSGSDMTLVPYESGLPTVPSANGSYVLKCTVTNGVVSYSWVAN